MHKGEKNKI